MDKGLVIDIYLRVSHVGIEFLTVDARIVIASVDTYLRFAEADQKPAVTDLAGLLRGLRRWRRLAPVCGIGRRATLTRRLIVRLEFINSKCGAASCWVQYPKRGCAVSARLNAGLVATL